MDKFDDQINMFEANTTPKRTKKHSLDAKAKKIIEEKKTKNLKNISLLNKKN